MLDHAEELFKQADLDGNGVLSPHEVPPPPSPRLGLGWRRAFT